MTPMYPTYFLMSNWQLSDGVGRSGTFCALFNCVNRFKAEQVVDVFQIIKSMRAQNPAVVQTTVSGSLFNR